MFLADYHIHSEISFDSHASMEEIVKKAIASGITHIAITDHFDPFQKDKDCISEYDPKKYFEELSRVRGLYGDKIDIAAGIEAGQAQLYPENVKKMLDSHDYDFVIGSVHNVTGDIDLAFETYTMANVSAWLSKYFLEAAEAAKTGLYDVFGHLNYICRYIAKQKIPVNVSDYEDMAIIVLRQAVSLGKGIEINVSGMRDGGASLPGIELIKKYRALGGEILTIGTDAHTPQNVGLCLEKGLELARRAGFKYIATFKERKPEFHKI